MARTRIKPSAISSTITVGNTASRPETTSNGSMRINSTTNSLEIFFNGFWSNVTTVGSNTAGGTGGGSISSVSDQLNTSTGYLDLPSGNTAQRPASPSVGAIRYNTTTQTGEIYTQNGWGPFGSVSPTISTVIPSTFNGETGTSVAIEGNFFTSDASVRFVTAGGTEYTAGSVIFNSTTSLTATTPRDFIVAEGPLSVKIVQPSGTVILPGAIQTGTSPAWSTAAGTLSTLYFPSDANYNLSLIALDTDTNATVTYSVTVGSLPSGATLAANGAITGTVANPNASVVTSTFTVVPTDNAGNQAAPREFSIIRKWQDGSNAEQAAPSAATIYDLSSLFRTTSANGKYWIKLPGQAQAAQVYCLMDSRADNGGWMLTYHKSTGGAGQTYKQLWYANSLWNNTTSTADATNFPVLFNTVSFGAQGFTKQLIHNQHPSWMSAKGNYQWYNLQTNINWSMAGSFSANNLNTTTGVVATTLLYNREQAWSGGTATLDTTFAWWADAGNGGLCGGANQCGTTACPTSGGVEGCHTNGSYPTLLYVK